MMAMIEVMDSSSQPWVEQQRRATVRTLAVVAYTSSSSSSVVVAVVVVANTWCSKHLHMLLASSQVIALDLVQV